MQSKQKAKIWKWQGYVYPISSARRHFNPLRTGNHQMGTMANSEDPDEMPHNAAFHQGLHCLLKQN